MENNKISSYDLSVLAEIGNIGAGNAATSLSSMINKTINLEVPSVNITKLTDIPELMGGAENLRTGLFFQVTGNINGYIMFILKDEDVQNITKLISNFYSCEMDADSIMSEVANIIAGSYIGALANMMNTFIEISPPEVGHDMIGSLIDSIISCLCTAADKTVVIGTELTIENEVVAFSSALLLELDSLNKILEYFKL